MGKKNRTKARENRIQKYIAIREGSWVPCEKEREEMRKILYYYDRDGSVPVKKLPEEKLDRTNTYGLQDPTPCIAIRNLINSNQLR